MISNARNFYLLDQTGTQNIKGNDYCCIWKRLQYFL